MRLLRRTDYLKINQFWKVICIDTVYTSSLFYLGYASLRNFYTHLLLPLFTKMLLRLALSLNRSVILPSPAGLVMAFLAAGVILT